MDILHCRLGYAMIFLCKKYNLQNRFLQYDENCFAKQAIKDGKTMKGASDMNKEITIAELKEKAKQLRKTAVTMIYEAQSGHPGGALSIADIVSCLYFREMNVDPKNPRWEDRDRFVLSKGHVCPIQYSALGLLGFFPEEDLHTLRKEGSKLQGHPSMNKCPGIDISTGSLGQGLSCAVGMALAGKRDGKDYMVYAVVGDGEADEGQIWEAEIGRAHV